MLRNTYSQAFHTKRSKLLKKTIIIILIEKKLNKGRIKQKNEKVFARRMFEEDIKKHQALI